MPDMTRPLHLYYLRWYDYQPLFSHPLLDELPRDVRVGRWEAISRTGICGQSVVTCCEHESAALKAARRRNAYVSLMEWLRDQPERTRLNA